MSAAFVTIQNPDPAGLAVLVGAVVILRVAVWIIPKFESKPEPSQPTPLKRCQSCGAQIDLIDGEWEHVDDNALLVLRASRHIPEPMARVH